MRFVAMKLHTKDQAPKEGGKEASQHPMREVGLWFLRGFLLYCVKLLLLHGIYPLKRLFAYPFCYILASFLLMAYYF